MRAITRVATTESEADLLNVALHGTAMHVERLVRQYRRLERLEDARSAETRHRARYLQMYFDEVGALVLSARLPAEVGAVVRQAIEAAMEAATAADEQAPQNAARNEQCCEPHSEPRNVPIDEQRHDGASTGVVRENVSAETFEGNGNGRRLPIELRRADALRLLAEQFLSDEARRCPSSADRYQVVVHVDASALAEDVRPGHVRCELKARDGGCRFPGCDHTRFTEGHHVEHWANGGETKLSNLITLCGFHHRLLPAEHADLGLDIDAATSCSRWLGEPMDYDLAIGAMWRRRDSAQAAAPA